MSTQELRQTTKWVLAEYGTDDRLTEEILRRGDEHIKSYADKKVEESGAK